jgi:hypothetical protein
LEAKQCRAGYRGKTLPNAKTEIGRAGNGLAQHLARKCGKPGPAARAAAIDAQQKRVKLHKRFRSVLLGLPSCS